MARGDGIGGVGDGLTRNSGGRSNIPITPLVPPTPADVGDEPRVRVKRSGDPPPAGHGPGGTAPSSGLSELLGGAGGKGLTREQAARELTTAALGAALSPTFGRDRVGAKLYWGGLSGTNLYLVYIVGPGPISAYNSVTIGGKNIATSVGAGGWGLTNGTDYKFYTGTASQTLDATLSGHFSEWTHRLQRIVYFWIKVPAATYNASGFDPLNVVVDLNGLLIRDYNQDNTLVNRYYSVNPAWAVAEILSNDWWGGGRGQSAPDGTIDWPCFAAAATICDNWMDAPTDSIRRFTLNLTLQDVSDLESWMAEIRACCDGFIVREQGVWRMFIDRPRTPTGIRFYDSASAGATPGAAITELMRIQGAGPNERYNRIVCTWVDPNDDFKDKQLVTEHPNVTQKIWPVRQLDLEVRGVRAQQQVSRIGTRALNRALLHRKYTLIVQQNAERLSINDAFEVTTIQGYTNLPLVLTNYTPGEHTITLIAEISDNTIFDDNIIAEPATVAFSLPDSAAAPPAPTSLVLTEQTSDIAPDGTGTERILVSWTNTAWLFQTRARVTVDTGSGEKDVSGVLASGVSSFLYSAPAYNVSTTFRVYSISPNGVPCATPLSGAITPAGPAVSTGVTSLARAENQTIKDATYTAVKQVVNYPLGCTFIPTGQASVKQYRIRGYVNVGGLGAAPSTKTWADMSGNEVIVPANSVLNGQIEAYIVSLLVKQQTTYYSVGTNTAQTGYNWTRDPYKISVRAETFTGALGTEVEVHDDTAQAASTGALGDDAVLKTLEVSGDTKLDAHLKVGSGAPAPSVAFGSTPGAGTGASIALEAGSTDLAGTITITTGSSPSSSGDVKLIFGTAFASHNPVILLTLQNPTGGGNWGGNAQILVSTESLSAPVFSWTNASATALVNLTASKTYRINYVAIGR